MIKSLRKRHHQVWMAWALLLPVGIILAWLAIPDQQPVRLLKEEPGQVLPQVVLQGENENAAAKLRKDTNGDQWQLEWISKNTLTVPSALIYDVTQPGSDLQHAVFIGRIETRGRYYFPVKIGVVHNSGLDLVLYDFIHEKLIDSIKLRP